jgi:hypothetical protein
MPPNESGWRSINSGPDAATDRGRQELQAAPYADRKMSTEQKDPKPDDEASKEQGQADDRRRKDQTEKLERDRADEAGRRSREGT